MKCKKCNKSMELYLDGFGMKVYQCTPCKETKIIDKKENKK